MTSPENLLFCLLCLVLTFTSTRAAYIPTVQEVESMKKTLTEGYLNELSPDRLRACGGVCDSLTDLLGGLTRLAFHEVWFEIS